MLKYHGVPYRSRQGSGLLGMLCPWLSRRKHMEPLEFFFFCGAQANRKKPNMSVIVVAVRCLVSRGGGLTFNHSFVPSGLRSTTRPLALILNPNSSSVFPKTGARGFLMRRRYIVWWGVVWAGWKKELKHVEGMSKQKAAFRSRAQHKLVRLSCCPLPQCHGRGRINQAIAVWSWHCCYL